jgi:hypothetical protein
MFKSTGRQRTAADARFLCVSLKTRSMMCACSSKCIQALYRMKRYIRYVRVLEQPCSWLTLSHSFALCRISGFRRAAAAQLRAAFAHFCPASMITDRCRWTKVADEAARHATRLAQYRPDDMPHCTADPQPPSHTQLWPVPADVDDANNKVERRPKQHTGDLGKDLKKYLHEKHRVEYSNTSSVYYQAWARTVNIAHKGHSTMLMQSNQMDPQDRVTTLRPLQIWWPQHSKTATPDESFTHSQLSLVWTNRWGTPFHEWLPPHEWDVHRTPQRRAYTVKSLAHRGKRIGCCHASHWPRC